MNNFTTGYSVKFHVRLQCFSSFFINQIQGNWRQLVLWKNVGACPDMPTQRYDDVSNIPYVWPGCYASGWWRHRSLRFWRLRITRLEFPNKIVNNSSTSLLNQAHYRPSVSIETGTDDGSDENCCSAEGILIYPKRTRHWTSAWFLKICCTVSVGMQVKHLAV